MLRKYLRKYGAKEIIIDISCHHCIAHKINYHDKGQIIFEVVDLCFILEVISGLQNTHNTLIFQLLM